MAFGDQQADDLCPGCGEKVQPDQLRVCTMCRSLFCHRCAVDGYGRSFCSDRCRQFFFHGDGDDEAEGDR